MSVKNITISGVVQGISKQAPSLRSPTQASVQLNCVSSVVRGLGKRPGTDVVASMGTQYSGNGHFHFIDRDETEKYVVEINDAQEIKVRSLLDGQEFDVQYASGSQTYLTAENGVKNSLQLLSNLDYTFVLNKEKTVEISPKIDPNGDVFKNIVEFYPTNSEWLVGVLVSNTRPIGTSGSYLLSSLNDTLFATDWIDFGTSSFGTQLKGKYLIFGTLAEADAWFREVYIPSFVSDVIGNAIIDTTTKQFTSGSSAPFTYSTGIDADVSFLAVDYPFEQKYKLPLFLRYPASKGYWTDIVNGLDEDGTFYSGTFDIQAEKLFLFRPQDTSTSYGVGGGNDPSSLCSWTGFGETPDEQDEGLRNLGASLKNNAGFSVNGEVYLEPVDQYFDDAGRIAYWFNKFQDIFPDATITTSTNIVNIEGTGITIRPLRNGYAKVSVEYVNPAQKVFIVIKQGVADQTYRVSINGVLAEFTTGDTNNPSTWRADHIAGQLASQLTASGDFYVETYGRVVVVSALDNTTDLRFDFMDSWNSQAMYVMKDRVQQFTDLPSNFIEKNPVEVVGTNGGSNYYVRFAKDKLKENTSTEQTLEETAVTIAHPNWVAREGKQSGSWEECTKRGLLNYLDETTMPHALIRKFNEDGSIYFSFETLPWAPRKVGDDISAPMPSIVGNSISDMVFFRGRFGLIGKESYILSKSNDFFNFFPTTVREIRDDDPIDENVSSSEITDLVFAQVFNQSMKLFSTKGQYIVGTTQQILTPRSVSTNPTTKFETYRGFRPTSFGDSIIMGTPTKQGLNLIELTIQPNQFLTATADITAHIPGYMGLDINMIDGSNVDRILLLSKQGSKDLFVYQHLTGPDGAKVQEAWHQWDFQGYTVEAFKFIRSELFLVMRANTSGELFLEKMPLKEFLDDLLDEAVMADHKSPLLPNGIPFDSKYTLSPILVRDRDGNAVLDKSVGLKSIAFNFTDSTVLEANEDILIKVKLPQKTNPIVFKFRENLGDKKFIKASFLSRGDKAEITFENNSSRQVFIQSFDYTGEVLKNQ